MSRKALVILAMTLMMGFASVDARAATSASPSPGSEKLVFHVGWTQDVDNLNPFVGQVSITYEIFALNYGTLVGSAPNGDPRPQIADSWTVSADGLTWTFKIHPGIKWQDGEPLTANDVAFTYNYVIDNDLQALSWNTKNMQEVVAVDDATVVFHLSQPRADMLRTAVWIVPEHIWSKVPGKEVEKYQVELPLVGAGPFQVVEHKPGSSTILAANKDYFMGAPTIDEVIFGVYTNQDTMAMDLKRGTIDLAVQLLPAQFKALEGTPGITARALDDMRYDELAMNCYDNPSSLGNPVLRDIEFRRAISWAVDKQQIVDLCMGGYATVGQSIVPPGGDGRWTPAKAETFGFDLEKAKQMLDAAGYKDADGDGIREDQQGKPIELRLWTRNESAPQQHAGKLITGWFESIGLKIDLKVMTDGAIMDALYAYKGDTYTPDFDMYIWGWTCDIDPDGSLANFTTKEIEWWNDCCWSNAEYDALEKQQIRELDWPKRDEMVKRMQQIFYEEAPYVVLYNPKSLMAYNSGKWDGWVHYPTENGLVLNTHSNIDTYLELHPKATASTSAGSSNTALIIAGAVIAAAAVVTVVLLLVRRSRRRTAEE